MRIMDKKIIRDLVKKHLSEKPRNTVEIKDWLSENISIEYDFDIAAILELDPSIIRIGRIMQSGVIGKEYPLSEWAPISPEILLKMLSDEESNDWLLS